MRSTTRHDRHNLPCRSLSGTILLSYVLLALHAVACAEQVELTTYYPAPFGVYDTLVAEKLVDYSGGTYNVPPVEGMDWFVDPSGPSPFDRPTSVSARLRGRVGIGVRDLPRGKFEVGDQDRLNLDIVTANDANGGWTNEDGLSVYSNTVAGKSALSISSGHSMATDRGLLNIYRGGAQPGSVFYVRMDGNIGVKTAAPITTLDIGADQDSSATLTLRNMYNVQDAGGAIYFSSYGSQADHPGPRIRSSLRFAAGPAASQSRLIMSSYFEGFKDEMTLFNGNVGIGTTDPQSTLHVRGPVGDNARLQLESQAGGSPIVRLFNANSAPGKKAWVMYNTAGRFAIHPTNDDYSYGGPAALDITHDGNVGIGTANPNATLDGTSGLAVYHAGSPGIGIANANRGYLWYLQADRLQLWDSTENVDRMVVLPNGNVGIGTSAPGYLLHVDGSAGKPGGGSWSDSSDARLKTSIAPLTGALDRLLQLRGVTYEWQAPEQHGNLRGPQIGMIAQEVERVFPEWVGTDPEGFKTLTFRGFEALTVESLRALRAENAQLRETLEQRVEALKETWTLQHDAELNVLRADNDALRQRLDALERGSAPATSQ